MTSSATEDFCIGCSDSLPPPGEREKILCSLCKQYYHTKCVNITKKMLTSWSSDVKSSWKCTTCMNITRRRGDNSNTPVRRATTLDDSVMSCDESMINVTPVKPLPATASGSDISLDSIALLLDSKLDSFKKSFMSDIKNLIKEEVGKTIEKLKIEFTETTDFLLHEQNVVKTHLEKAEQRVKDLEQQNSSLQNHVGALNRRLESMEKISRSHNIEIQAVPEKKTENILTIVKNLYATVDLPISDSEISACRRVAKLPTTSANRPRNILVTLPSARHRDTIISAVKRFNRAHLKEPLNSHHIGVSGDKCIIYVCEHLSPETKELHACTRKALRDKYRYVWVKFGNIYIRKDDNSPVIHIKNKEILDKLSA